MKIELALLMLVMVSPLWVMPLSAPVVSDVVVVMHHDSAVSTAVHTITANDPRVQVVEYGSLEYALIIHRTIGRVVWVSHGSEEGILAESHILSWKAFSSRTEMTPGKDIVLACGSSHVNRYVPPTSVIGFGSSSIDATLGGLLVLFLLGDHDQDGIITRVWERAFALATGHVSAKPLALGLFTPIAYVLPSTARTYLLDHVNTWVTTSVLFPFLWYHVQANLQIESLVLHLNLVFDLFGGVYVPLLSVSGLLNIWIDTFAVLSLVVAIGAGIFLLNIPSPVPWQIALGISLVGGSVIGAIAYAEYRLGQGVWDENAASALMVGLFLASLASIILGYLSRVTSRIGNAGKFVAEAASSTPPAITGLAKMVVAIAAFAFFALSLYYALYR